jgi:RNA polymerase sigma-54 factor
MRFETSQQMRLGQQMRLAPRMIQSMEILQMPLAELEERIQQELESNPTLELQDGSPDAEAPPRPEAEPVPETQPLTMTGEPTADEFARLESYERANPEAIENEYAQDLTHSDAPATDERFEGVAPRARTDDDERADYFAGAPARGLSLLEQLRGQWALAEVDQRVRDLGETILAYIEEDGYLRTSLEQISATMPEDRRASPEELERALKALQLFLEPAGIGARDARECLLLQLDSLEESRETDWPTSTFRHARALVSEHLDDITQNRLPRVAERSGLSLEEIREAMTLLRRLSLAPARRLVEEDNRPIVPDVIVEYDEAQDRYLVYLNDRHLPQVRINREYAKMAKDRAASRRDREFLRTNLSNAQWLLEALGQRRETLLRVAREVVEAQREFFDFGPGALKPLPMTAVAEKLGIHVATVSRAVANKYIATPRGVLPLRKFFSGGVTAANEDGERSEMAWDAIKAALKEIIDGEDRSRPYSDEQLVEELRKRGIEIARRTVAKYRDQMNIPTARLRRKF